MVSNRHIVTLTESQLFTALSILESANNGLDDPGLERRIDGVVKALNKYELEPVVERRGFVQGTAHAVAMLIRCGEIVMAEYLWATLGTSMPGYVDRHDAGPIRKQIKCDWGRK